MVSKETGRIQTALGYVEKDAREEHTAFMALTRTAFARYVDAGIRRIPAHFRRQLNDIALVIDDRPSSEQQRAARLRRGESLLGLYEGTPRTERQYAPFIYPEKITLFRQSFAELCGTDVKCLEEEVAHTVWHELGHALGLSEHAIRAREARRKGRRKARIETPSTRTGAVVR